MLPYQSPQLFFLLYRHLQPVRRKSSALELVQAFEVGNMALGGKPSGDNVIRCLSMTIGCAHIPFSIGSVVSSSGNYCFEGSDLGKVQGLIDMAEIAVNFTVLRIVRGLSLGFVNLPDREFVDLDFSIGTCASVYELVSRGTSLVN